MSRTNLSLSPKSLVIQKKGKCTELKTKVKALDQWSAPIKAISEANIVFDRSGLPAAGKYGVRSEPRYINSQDVQILGVDAYWHVTLSKDDWQGKMRKFNVKLFTKDESILESRPGYKVGIKLHGSTPEMRFERQMLSLTKPEIKSACSFAFAVEDRFEMHLSVTIYHSLSGKGKNVNNAVAPVQTSWIVTPKMIGELYDSGEFADFTYHVEDKSFKVHKSILAAASEVFKNTFTCGLDETKNNEATIVDCDAEVFDALMNFIYKNEMPETESDNIAMELYKLAHLYQIETLQDVCYGRIASLKVDVSNAMEYYDFARAYDLQELSTVYLTFMKANVLKMKIDEIKKIQEIETIKNQEEAESAEKI